MNMPKTASVSLKKCESYQPEILSQSLRECLEPLGGMRAFVRPNERILLKPNLVTTPSGDRPACTDGDFVIEVARLVRECGAVPFISDSPAFGSARQVARQIGLFQKAEREGIEICEMRGSISREIRIDGKIHRLPVAATAIQADGIINLPKFKAHRQATFSFAVKNLYGCVPGKRKACRHFASGGDREWFSNMLVANALILAPRLNLVDGITGMEGQGPVRGTARDIGVIAAGVDPVAVDSICCEVAGCPPLSLCTQNAARKMGAGVWDPEKINLLGDPLEDLRIKDFGFAREIPIFFSLPQLARSYLKSWRAALAPE